MSIPATPLLAGRQPGVLEVKEMGVHAVFLTAALVAHRGCPSGPVPVPVPKLAARINSSIEGPVPIIIGAPAPSKAEPYAAAGAAIQSGDKAFNAGDKATAARAFRRAAAAFARATPSRDVPGTSFVMGTVLHLAYYFAATGDRTRARSLWHVFMEGEGQVWAQPANPAIGNFLERGRTVKRFLQCSTTIRISS